MEIYLYNCNDKELKKIRDLKVKSKEREKLVQEYIVRTGTRLTPQQYFSDNGWNRRNQWRNGKAYHVVGEPQNIIERLIYSEVEYDSQLYYVNARYDHPEDLVESRTDWEEMKSYADELASFIDDVKQAIGNGTIVLSNNEEMEE